MKKIKDSSSHRLDRWPSSPGTIDKQCSLADGDQTPLRHLRDLAIPTQGLRAASASCDFVT